MTTASDLPLPAGAVALILTEWGRRLLLAGDNPYRARAFLQAAEAVALVARPLVELADSGRLRDVPGVGASIAAIIEVLVRTGSHPTLDALREIAPAGLLELLTLPGIRPERVARMHRDLGIASVADLANAVADGRLAGAKGFGPAFTRKLSATLAARQEGKSSLHLHRAAALLAAAEAQLRDADPTVGTVVPAGDFRRGNELVADLALVTEADGREPGAVRQGPLTVHRTDAARFGATLLFATGSVAHLQELQALAAERGLVLAGDGLRRNGTVIAARTEADIYAALGLPFIAPELREGRGEIARAEASGPEDLVGIEDLRGILHAHTVASDGVATLAAMAEATRDRGFGYFGIADHSQSAFYAGGLKAEAVLAQHEEIDRLNAGFAGCFRIFKGIESDILADGALDYPSDILARFDFVVASVHGRFALDRDAQTARIVRAVENPFTTILGHMTGRQLLRRPGYEVDIERVLAACAANGVAVEINANPWRLDLDWRWHRRGLELGCTFAINPDAHSTGEIDMVRWGVLQARKGGVRRERVLNTLDAEAFAAFLAERKRRW